MNHRCPVCSSPVSDVDIHEKKVYASHPGVGTPGLCYGSFMPIPSQRKPKNNYYHGIGIQDWDNNNNNG